MSDQAPNIEPGKGKLVYDKARRTIVAVPAPEDAPLTPAAVEKIEKRAFAAGMERAAQIADLPPTSSYLILDFDTCSHVAAAIRASNPDIPALIATLRAQAKEIERLKSALEAVVKEADEGFDISPRCDAIKAARAALHPHGEE